MNVSDHGSTQEGQWGETWNLPQSLWLWSPLPPLRLRLGSSGLLALITGSVHQQMRSSTRTPPPPERALSPEEDPFVQGESKTFAGMIWNSDSWPHRKWIWRSTTIYNWTDDPFWIKLKQSSWWWHLSLILMITRLFFIYIYIFASTLIPSGIWKHLLLSSWKSLKT